MNPCIFAFVNRQPTALLLEARDEGTDYLEQTLPQHVTVIGDISEATPDRFRLVIIVSPFMRSAPEGMLELHFVPMIGTIGFGLAHEPDDAEDIYDQIDEAFAQRGVLPCANRYCTIDVKSEEPFVDMLVLDYQAEVRFFTAEQLAAVDVPNPSATVQKHVGTPSVCEAAAILGSNNGTLIIPKVKGRHWHSAARNDIPLSRRSVTARPPPGLFLQHSTRRPRLQAAGERAGRERRSQFAQKIKIFQTIGKYLFLFGGEWVIILTTFVRRIITHETVL